MAGFALQVPRGDTIPLSVEITRDGSPVDVTGATLRFTAKRSVKDDDADALIHKAIGTGITVTDAVAGLAVIVIDPSDTNGFTRDLTLQCDVQMVETDGTITTVARGTLEVVRDVTRTAP